jgi:hypothetical protein
MTSTKAIAPIVDITEPSSSVDFFGFTLTSGEARNASAARSPRSLRVLPAATAFRPRTRPAVRIPFQREALRARQVFGIFDLLVGPRHRAHVASTRAMR